MKNLIKTLVQRLNENNKNTNEMHILTKTGPKAIEILLIIDMVVEWWNRQFGCETIHPTQTFISMNLLQMSCMITWA